MRSVGNEDISGQARTLLWNPREIWMNAIDSNHSMPIRLIGVILLCEGSIVADVPLPLHSFLQSSSTLSSTHSSPIIPIWLDHFPSLEKTQPGRWIAGRKFKNSNLQLELLRRSVFPFFFFTRLGISFSLSSTGLSRKSTSTQKLKLNCKPPGKVVIVLEVEKSGSSRPFTFPLRRCIDFKRFAVQWDGLLSIIEAMQLFASSSLGPKDQREAD